MQKGFIRLSSLSAAAPIFYVKVDGKADRPCVDYSILNGMTIRDSYHFPVISHLLNNLYSCKFLSKIDLKAAFNLLRVAPGHEWKTAFCTPWGFYKYQVMPFGLANAPATFQRFIKHVLRKYLDVCCFVYIDDILIFLKTKEGHLQDLENILRKLREYSLKASLSNCEFFCAKVTFLGFDITEHGLKMNEKKLETIKLWPYPTNLKELRPFLGFTNFDQRFIPRFSEVAGPLTLLTKKNVGKKVEWKTELLLTAFEKLKELFFIELLLRHFDFRKERWIHIDSSVFAIAAVLSQPDDTGILLPVSYFSPKLSDRERSWMIFDLELLAIVEAFEEWRAWLMGTSVPVKVFLDRSNLLYFKTAKYLSPKQARWALFLDNFNMLIYHVAGKSNPANAPSRREDYTDGTPLIPDSQVISNCMVQNDEVGVSNGDANQSGEGYHDISFQQPHKDLIEYFAKHYTDDELKLLDVRKLNDLFWFCGRIFVPSVLRTR
jgi:hypothetical protein